MKIILPLFAFVSISSSLQDGTMKYVASFPSTPNLMQIIQNSKPVANSRRLFSLNRRDCTVPCGKNFAAVWKADLGETACCNPNENCCPDNSCAPDNGVCCGTDQSCPQAIYVVGEIYVLLIAAFVAPVVEGVPRIIHVVMTIHVRLITTFVVAMVCRAPQAIYVVMAIVVRG